MLKYLIVLGFLIINAVFHGIHISGISNLADSLMLIIAPGLFHEPAPVPVDIEQDYRKGNFEY